MDRTSRLHLLIDADDTLWHNNSHFERAIEDFLDYLDHSALSRSEARAVLDEIEHANAAIHGYGSAVFTISLTECYRRLAERHIDDSDIQRVMHFGERILSADIELIDGVEETLVALGSRHHLTIFTKGNADEQRLKINRSGLGGLFAHQEIVPEKNVNSYELLVRRLQASASTTWMIGNSPKSDINPALAAGLGAVYIPHEATWVLEHAGIDDGHERLLVLNRFTDLVEYF